ncbi:P protein-like [Drosophila novamexicana]|uniref:P protein-like n=1 Tax=Drosophila novamexicana TaxID=47314 RepID=UPI0011E5CC43|nr:P protein-like [Drosophila novamexicana]
MTSHNPHATKARRSFYLHNEDESNLTPEQQRRRKFLHYVYLVLKLATFIGIWLFFAVSMLLTPPNEHISKLIPLESEKPYIMVVDKEPEGNEICVYVKGNIDADITNNPKVALESQKYILVSVRTFNTKSNTTEWNSKEWKVYLYDSPTKPMESVKRYFELEHKQSKMLNFKVRGVQMRVVEMRAASDVQLQVILSNQNTDPTAVALTVDTEPLNKNVGILSAAGLLIFLYVLIIWDIMDRTFAALFVATTAIGVLCVLGERPTIEVVISWIDTDTMMLLFGMMILVSVIAETGIFGYISVLAYRLSKGQPWLLLFLLCMLTVLLSAILDNVTILMLMVPIVIRLCECMDLRTTTVLIIVAIFSNIGGALTPVGDPPNVIIASNRYVLDAGTNFCDFVMHMLPGVVLSLAAAWAYIYFVLRKGLQQGGADQMRESINNLAKTAAVLRETPSEAELRREILERIEELKERYRRKATAPQFGPQPTTNFIETLAEMQARYKVEDKPLLIKCCIALAFAVLLFMLHSLPFLAGATLSWTAFLAALLLLILANKRNIHSVLESVEWSTLLFFASLFVFIEACAELGLIDWVGDRTIAIIVGVDEKHRLITAIILVLWISAIFSAFVDNIPIVTMMLKLVIKLSLNADLKVPLLPLVWALSYGVCYGGNGTLIAASSNVVAAGIANQYGYKITFLEFFKYGFPVMILTDIISSLYLIIAHGLFQWH